MALPGSLRRPLLLLAFHAVAIMQALPRAAALPLRHEVSAAISSALTAGDGAGVLGEPAADGGFLAALRDEPAGAYFELLAPLVHAVDITYTSSSGPLLVASRVNDTIPPEAVSGEEWVRFPALEADPERGGVHMRVFVNHKSKRVICGFRGVCLDDEFRQCQVDLCFLQSYQAFGKISNITYHTSADCGAFSGEFNYFEQAESHVKRVQAEFPGYSVLLTGHSLGGAMSISVAASQPGVLKAITFAPTAFHAILLNHVGLSDADIGNLPAQDLIALGDPYDCLINSAFVSNARVGATTCLLEGLEEPMPCNPRMQKDAAFDVMRLPQTMACKGSTHDWLRYMEILLAQKEGGIAPANLPTCSTAFSTSQAELAAFLQRSGRGLPEGF